MDDKRRETDCEEGDPFGQGYTLTVVLDRLDVDFWKWHRNPGLSEDVVQKVRRLT